MKIELREWKDEDIDNLVSCANNKNVSKNLRNIFPYPYTKKDGESYLKFSKSVDKTKTVVKAIVVDGIAVGGVGIERKDDIYEKTADLGYWLAEPFWGKGIVTYCVKEICKTAFQKWDIVRIFAEVFARNTGSRRVLEKNNFVLEGVFKKNAYKDGEYIDTCLYALLKEDNK